MREYKTKILASITVLSILAAAWFLGSPPVATPANNAKAAPASAAYALRLGTHESTEAHETYTNHGDKTPKEYISKEDISEEDISKEDTPLPYPAEKLSQTQTEHAEEATPETYEQTTASHAYTQVFGTPHPNMREPEEPETVAIGGESFSVSLEVRVDTILANMHMLNAEKHELVPPSGVIFPATTVIAYSGESVFNVLQREMRRAGIHMSSRFTPIFNSAYVEAINNLYEFDVGPLSGWMYRVNGWFPNFGASRYLLSPGDEIQWLFTTDLGRDLGVTWLEEGQVD